MFKPLQGTEIRKIMFLNVSDYTRKTLMYHGGNGHVNEVGNFKNFIIETKVEGVQRTTERVHCGPQLF